MIAAPKSPAKPPPASPQVIPPAPAAAASPSISRGGATLLQRTGIGQGNDGVTTEGLAAELAVQVATLQAQVASQSKT